MIDNDTLSDAELVALVGKPGNHLGKLLQARLRRLRLARNVTGTTRRTELQRPNWWATLRRRFW